MYHESGLSFGVKMEFAPRHWNLLYRECDPVNRSAFTDVTGATSELPASAQDYGGQATSQATVKSIAQPGHYAGAPRDLKSDE
jgi:hypothetical protein